MNRMLLIVMAALAGMCLQAQNRPVKQGAVLHYLVLVPNATVLFDVRADSVSANHIALGWHLLSNDAYGNWRMHGPALDSAAKGFWEAPQDGSSLDFSNDQMVFLFSRKNWQEIQQANTTTYDGVVYRCRKRSGRFALQKGYVKSIYLESDDASSKIWLLNDEKLPIIIKMEGNAYKVNLTLQAIDGQ